MEAAEKARREGRLCERPVELAERLGVTRQCIGEYIKRGRITEDAIFRTIGPKVLIDVELALAQLRGRLDRRKHARQGRARIEFASHDAD